jgi:hypothetical protein
MKKTYSGLFSTVAALVLALPAHGETIAEENAKIYDKAQTKQEQAQEELDRFLTKNPNKQRWTLPQAKEVQALTDQIDYYETVMHEADPE